MENKFYVPSDWNPPKACVEVENFISRLQEKFDLWKPRRWVKDNLSHRERQALNQIRKDAENVIMWEDKGPSFTKMTKVQYFQAGDTELSKTKYYSSVNQDKSVNIEKQCNFLVEQMVQKGEISEKLGEYLRTSDSKIPQFYHVIKTHNIPTDIRDLSHWLGVHGYPVRGIISGKGGPFEKLSGLVDHFLQPGMVKLPSYLQDTKHTLQVIESINDQIDRGEMSLENVSLITLDIDKMYNNMTEELARGACSKFLHSFQVSGSNEENSVSVSSILKALDICLKNNFFKFNEKIYHQKEGVGTGVKFAPPYACIGMG